MPSLDIRRTASSIYDYSLRMRMRRRWGIHGPACMYFEDNMRTSAAKERGWCICMCSCLHLDVQHVNYYPRVPRQRSGNVLTKTK